MVQQNIMKICDFGIAKVLHGKGYERTQTSGTLEYMSPESIKNKEYSLKTDVWYESNIKF